MSDYTTDTLLLILIRNYSSDIKNSPLSFNLLASLHQVEDSVHIAEALLWDLSGFKGFLLFCDDLLEILRAYEQEQFEDWSRDILSGLADPKSGIRLEILQTLTFALSSRQKSSQLTSYGMLYCSLSVFCWHLLLNSTLLKKKDLTCKAYITGVNSLLSFYIKVYFYKKIILI